MANIINGKTVAAKIKNTIKEQIPLLEHQYGRRPSLCVIMVGNDSANQGYVRNKVQTGLSIGIDARLMALEDNISEAELLKIIHVLNEDPLIDGILVQLPLPAHMNEERVVDAVAKNKDVDGFHTLNVGALWQGTHCIAPCTPKGIIQLIKTTEIPISGKTAVVVGRSNIVGKPVAKLLLDENATVIMAHSYTEDLKKITLLADILIVAVGKEKIITADMIKPGAIVIDVGNTYNTEGKLVGDVDFEGACEVAGYITPVPGGVGPLTIAMLMINTMECFLSHVEANTDVSKLWDNITNARSGKD
ncbi:MAG: tetrahydrofolate dehydrogenase/cyclohydrolase catalytic domain-containing protein [Bacteroidales bacterium]|jgi:methylenetetrahydrofolate dehydrogenase (NADP+) / methenyltetrahydrofolate cyclohydrolase|nr:bifunctional methylenetetrahydrofolate dehydrogenase/methenyltetrahydrofolate cyclohydrolase [Bacteroidales bacterium]MDD4394382.1 tetrahydrofolate dehydrogenase/cyclohydrolase catalytic domain-containing protein [Bacteroidales bacterium]